jgi:ribose-phosphate pyrophosphokinase
VCKLAGHSAGRITAVTPYFPYVRSDKKNEPRISVTARLMAGRAIDRPCRIMAIDLGHSEFLAGHWTFSFSMAALARHSCVTLMRDGTTEAELLNSRTLKLLNSETPICFFRQE